MWTKEWDSSYVGFTTDGADWLVKHTNIKFVGTGLSSGGFLFQMYYKRLAA